MQIIILYAINFNTPDWYKDIITPTNVKRLLFLKSQETFQVLHIWTALQKHISPITREYGDTTYDNLTNIELEIIFLSPTSIFLTSVTSKKHK